MIDYLPLVLTGIGIIVAIIYYTLTLRNTNKTQQMQLETRQVQFLIEFNQIKIQTMVSDFNDIMNSEWTDFDDWHTKYGAVNNPESYAKRDRLWESYHINGLLIRDGMIDIETYIDYMGDTPILMWEKYQDIIKELRIRISLPTFMKGFEILADEITEYRTRKGWGPKTNNLIKN